MGQQGLSPPIQLLRYHHLWLWSHTVREIDFIWGIFIREGDFASCTLKIARGILWAFKKDGYEICGGKVFLHSSHKSWKDLASSFLRRVRKVAASEEATVVATQYTKVAVETTTVACMVVVLHCNWDLCDDTSRLIFGRATSNPTQTYD
jgi:hypothetical protein